MNETQRLNQIYLLNRERLQKRLYSAKRDHRATAHIYAKLKRLTTRKLLAELG